MPPDKLIFSTTDINNTENPCCESSDLMSRSELKTNIKKWLLMRHSVCWKYKTYLSSPLFICPVCFPPSNTGPSPPSLSSISVLSAGSQVRLQCSLPVPCHFLPPSITWLPRDDSKQERIQIQQVI